MLFAASDAMGRRHRSLFALGRSEREGPSLALSYTSRTASCKRHDSDIHGCARGWWIDFRGCLALLAEFETAEDEVVHTSPFTPRRVYPRHVGRIWADYYLSTFEPDSVTAAR
jgi:hypothetical protein